MQLSLVDAGSLKPGIQIEKHILNLLRILGELLGVNASFPILDMKNMNTGPSSAKQFMTHGTSSSLGRLMRCCIVIGEGGMEGERYAFAAGCVLSRKGVKVPTHKL